MSKFALAVTLGLALSLPLIQPKPDTLAQNSSPAQAAQSAPAAPQGFRSHRHGMKFDTTLNQPPTPTTPGAAPAAAATAAGAPKKKVEEPSLVSESPQNTTATKAGWSKFYNYIALQPGEEQLALTLTVNNGPDGKPAYSAVRIFLSGQPLLTEKDFKAGVATVKMDGTLQAGQNQLVIQAYAPAAGATYNWKLTTLAVSITTIKPTDVVVGDSITITGRHFSAKPESNIVQIGDKSIYPTAATTKSLTVTVPDLKTGEYPVRVSVSGMVSKSKKIKVKGAPELTGVNMVSTPPGQPLTISGKGFSAKASENEVTIGGMPATIMSASESSITVVVPNLEFPSWHQKIEVKTNKVPAKGSVEINLNSRVIPNDGVPEQ